MSSPVGGLHSIFDRPQPLSERDRAELMQRFAQSNADVARRYLGEEKLFDV